MMEKTENHISNESYNLQAYSCKVCKKEGVKTNIKKHIEVHHIKNIALVCPLCEKTCSSMTALVYHKKTSHSSAMVILESKQSPTIDKITNSRKLEDMESSAQI